MFMERPCIPISDGYTLPVSSIYEQVEALVTIVQFEFNNIQQEQNFAKYNTVNP